MKKISSLFVPFLGFALIGSAQMVTIGTQVWSTKNLDVATFSNGDSIPQAITDEEWIKAGENNQPAWCYYDNDPANDSQLGKLYNWHAVNDPRGLAPKGWHIPSDAEWTVLANYLGGENAAGTKLKSTSGWEENGNGTNESGFSALPGGFRDFDGVFSSIFEEAIWWSSSEHTETMAWGRYLSSYEVDFFRNNYSVQDGYSVRCLRD